MSTIEAADEQYICNSLLVKALLQFLSAEDRAKTKEWLLRFDQLGYTMSQVKIRNEYVLYLLSNVQNGHLSPPFNKFPPKGNLKPLCSILPCYLYKDTMNHVKKSQSWLTTSMLDANEDQSQVPLKTTPELFESRQPHPRNGITVLCSAFSDYNEQTRDK